VVEKKQTADGKEGAAVGVENYMLTNPFFLFFVHVS
jgi:hypothetical protein